MTTSGLWLSGGVSGGGNVGGDTRSFRCFEPNFTVVSPRQRSLHRVVCKGQRAFPRGGAVAGNGLIVSDRVAEAQPQASANFLTPSAFDSFLLSAIFL